MQPRLLIAIGIIIIVVVGGLVVISTQAPELTAVDVMPCVQNDDAECLRLPTVTGDTIDGDTLTLPDDLTGAYNLVVMPFDQEQQENAADWLPVFQAMSAGYDDVAYYSVAALPDLAPAIRVLVQMGLNAGVRDPDVRQRAIVLYLQDQAAFMQALDVADDAQIQLLILNAQGEVLWRGAGNYDDTTAEVMRQALADITS